MIEDDDLVEKYISIWDKVSANIKKIQLLQTKIESHDNEVTDFYDEKISKVDSNLRVQQRLA